MDTTIIESRNEGQMPGQLRIGGEDVQTQITEDFFLTQEAPAPKYPRVNAAGETVWACCESSIGPECQHRAAPQPGFWDDVEVIHSYSRADAIADGTLVDVSELAAEAGFRHPVAMTRAAWVDLVQWDDADEKRKGFTGNSETGRLWDVLNITAAYARRAAGDRFQGHVLRIPREGRGTMPRRAFFKVVIGPGDDPRPVLTIMQTNED